MSLRAVPLCFLLVLVPACGSSGGSGGSGGSGWSTGLDGSLALSDLTDEQQISACEAGDETGANWEADNADMITRANCYMSVSLTLGFSPESDCQELYDDCVAGEGGFAEDPEDDITPGEGDGAPEEESCADQVEDFSECTDVTVADLEACGQARFEILESGFQALAAGTCEDIAAGTETDGPDELIAALPDLGDVPECVEIEEKCPALDLSGESNVTTGGGGEDLCADVNCDVGPYCDGDKLVEVLGSWCNPITGECEGGGTAGMECPDGCADGACIGDRVDPVDNEEEGPPATPEPSAS